MNIELYSRYNITHWIAIDGVFRYIQTISDYEWRRYEPNIPIEMRRVENKSVELKKIRNLTKKELFLMLL